MTQFNFETLKETEKAIFAKVPYFETTSVSPHSSNALLSAVGAVKVRTEKEQDKWSKTTKFYVNDVFICECEVGGDYYCTVSRSGNPSTIRNKWKKTYKTKWQHWEIRNLLGEKYNKDDFKDEYPDLRFGYQGSVVSAKKVKEIFGKYLNSETVTP